MNAKIACSKRFAHYLLRTVCAFATATCHTQALPKFTQGARAIAYGFAYLAFGNSIAEANVHGAPESYWKYLKSQ
jgi:hypothetical protein